MTNLAPLDVAIRSPAVRAVFTHWQAARGAQRLPAWRDIDPAAFGKYLAKIWAWRFDPERDTFIGRLAGEDIIAIMGTGMRGRPFAECFPPDSVAAVEAHFRKIVDRPGILHATGLVYRQAAGSHAQGERLVLPLADRGVLGITDYRLNLGEGPGVDGAIVPCGEEIVFHSLA